MPTYAIKAPNGKTYQIDGPAGASDDAVRMQVLKQFPEAAGSPAPAKPRQFTSDEKLFMAAATPQPKKWEGLPPAKAKQILATAQESLLRKAGSDPAMRARVLESFNTHPDMQRLRQIAGLPQFMTRKQAVKETARRVIQENRDKPSAIPVGVRDTAASFISAGNDALYGIPARIAAKLTGTPNDVMQEFAAQQGERAPVNNFIQTLGLSLLTGAGEAKAIGAGLSRVAASSAPKIARAGKLVEDAITFKKGQTAANAARIVGAGGAAGGLEAGVKDKSITEGAAVGAAGAGLLIGGGKTLGALLVRPASDLLRTTTGKAILRRYIQTPIEDIQRLASEWKAKNPGIKREPTIYEVLPLEDRESVKTFLKRSPASVRESAASQVNQRAAEIGPDLADVTSNIIAPAQNRRVAKVAEDLATSRGDTTPTPEELALAEKAARAPLDMRLVRKSEARNIMAPHDEKTAYENISDLYPQHPETTKKGTVQMVADDPEIISTIRNAAGALRLKSNITIGNVTKIMSRLSKKAYAGDDLAAQALNHIEDILVRDHPEVAPAIEQMRSTNAARRRVEEGMAEGARTRLRENIPSSDTNARAVENAYGTPEGATGRALGQAAQIEQNVLASPSDSIRAIEEIANNPTTQEAISRNLGGSEGQQIADAAKSQAESARRLLGLKKETTPEERSSLQGTMQALLSLSPGAMIGTRLRGFKALGSFFNGYTEGRAQTIVDALFSRNPTKVAKALKWFNNQGDSGKAAIASLRNSLVAGGVAAPQANEALSQPDMSPEITDQPAQLQDAPPVYMAVDNPPGLLEPGNLDLNARPTVQNPDGSISTVRSITVGFDDGYYLLPTVIGDRIVSNDEAIAHFRQTHEHLGKFASQDDADNYAQQLHEQQGSQYGGGENSPYTAQLQAVYDNENPELLDLVDRVEQQESGGDQSAVSPAGAVGVMQVMPDTAPEAAKLAGVKWDPQAYRTDANYNRLLGIAYLSEMLRRYDGDVEKALAAYNAGPGSLESAMASHGDNWLAALPGETQDYVARIS